MSLAAVVIHLANKPHGWALAFLVIAMIAFLVGGVYAFLLRAFWACVLMVGLIFFVGAFIVSN
jgi:hypothetical protein